MSTDTADGLRARISRQSEDALGRLAQELLESPFVSGALSRAFEAREKARRRRRSRWARSTCPPPATSSA